jgi:hypothetical protein
MSFDLGFNGNVRVAVAFSADGLPVRDVRDCADVIRMSHTGWFTDLECGNSAIGIVGRLNHGRFAAGYRLTDNGEHVIFCDSVFLDESDAAKMADEHARIIGEQEQEQEHAERWQAVCLAELDAENKLLDVQKAFALRHRAKFGGPARVRDAIEELRKARETLADATRSYENA